MFIHSFNRLCFSFNFKKGTTITLHFLTLTMKIRNYIFILVGMQYIVLCLFQIYNIVIRHFYTLQCEHPTKSSNHVTMQTIIGIFSFNFTTYLSIALPFWQPSLWYLFAMSLLYFILFVLFFRFHIDMEPYNTCFFLLGLFYLA